MTYLFLTPKWFFGYDIILELLFAIITLTVSLFAFKIYKLSGQKQSKLFGIGFLLISLSYFAQSFINFAIVSKLNENICQTLKIISVNTLNIVGIYLYMALFLTGLITLTYMTFRLLDLRIFTIILIIVLLSVILNSRAMYLFYILSSLLLIYIIIHYLKNYLHKKRGRILLILTAFIFLLFGRLHFIFSINHELFYALGHILELIAYLLILINLILIIKKK